MRFLSGADVLFMCSEYEGLPLVVLEAMARGTIPVVTDIAGGLREVIASGENGFLYPVERDGAGRFYY